MGFPPLLIGTNSRARWARMSSSENIGPAEANTARASMESVVNFIFIVSTRSQESGYVGDQMSNDSGQRIETYLAGTIARRWPG